MRTLITVTCSLTLAASAWLGLMFVVLHRPGFVQGLVLAAFFFVQSALALGVTNGWLPQIGWRVVAGAGAIGLIWAGSRAVATNLSSNRFEGYALIIGVLLVIQGLLTVLTPSSKVHQFGN